MNSLWQNVTAVHIKKAIEIIDQGNVQFPEPRNTFLVYNGKNYPAKHIRGMAYKMANGADISKNEYSGGEETARFLRNLGFTVDYKRKILGPGNIKNKPVIPFKTEPDVSKPSPLGYPVDQKNALLNLLRSNFEKVETEKKFEWLKTPGKESLPAVYIPIVQGLNNYRNQPNFYTPDYSLACDFVLESEKIIIEYDERQHFTRARLIALDNYPSETALGFSKQEWIQQCETIDARDDIPPFRDEQRAFYDSVRDIESARNGYRLIRIKDGDVDWNSAESYDFLHKLIPGELTDNQLIHKKIARIVVRGAHFDPGQDRDFSLLQSIFSKFARQAEKNYHFDFIITPGGFFHFTFPPDLHEKLSIEYTEKYRVERLKSHANKLITHFFNRIEKPLLRRLQTLAGYITLGIDGTNPISGHRIELVGVFDLHSGKVIHWTGKSYPVSTEFSRIIKINDLKSHLLTLKGERILLFACHDLNIFSPRGQAVQGANSWKKMKSLEYRTEIQNFKPTLVIQHPHKTDSANIWKAAWSEMLARLPDVEDYASGINYENPSGNNPRQSVEKVLAGTKYGSVEDFIVSIPGTGVNESYHFQPGASSNQFSHPEKKETIPHKINKPIPRKSFLQRFLKFISDMFSASDYGIDPADKKRRK